MLRSSRTDLAHRMLRPSRTDLARLVLRGIVASALAACTPSPAAPTLPRCPIDRAVVIVSQADAARLTGCTTLRSITIRSGGSLDLSVLGALTTLTSDLTIGPTVAVEEVTLRGLSTVEGAIHVVGNGLLQGIFLPKLERAGRVVIDGNVAITTLSLPRLAAVRGAFRVTDNASLELIDIPALTSVHDELVLTHNPKLTLVESGELRAAGQVELDAPKLSAELTQRLRSLMP
ncbi:MAG: hypothetical protein H7138_20995 [Myxococcales bacterium]|nr:hypothetical protein [Myxococcales bacterium]